MHSSGISRRHFLRFWPTLLTGFSLTGMKPGMAATSMSNLSRTNMMHKLQDQRIGLALGAGGANGLAHILMLEIFDELGIKPHRISGSSIGAVIGALYASSNSARDILHIADNMIVRENDSWKEAFLHKDIFEWIDFVEPELGKGGLISGNAFLSFLYKRIKVDRFEELSIPLSIVATDFWKREQVIMESGNLLPAIQGSMAIPGLFTPVAHEQRILVDGGLVNPVPFDILFEDCDFVIAIDVCGEKTQREELSFFDSVFNTFQIMQQSIVREKLVHKQPDIYIRPRISDVRALEFHKLDGIFKQAEPAKQQLREAMQQAFA